MLGRHKPVFVQGQDQDAHRAGVERTLSQRARDLGLGRARYIGLDTTHLQHVVTTVALNFVRIGHWLDGQPSAQTRPSASVRLHRPLAAREFASNGRPADDRFTLSKTQPADQTDHDHHPNR